jgi:hypothetical protein
MQTTQESTMTTLRLNDTGPAVAALQRALNTKTRAGLTDDGHFGTKTEQALRRFQAGNNLTPDGIAGPNTQVKLEIIMPSLAPITAGPGNKSLTLTTVDYRRAAGELQCPPSMIHAISLKETRGKPFLPDGRPVILFERHQFFKRMRDRALAAKLAQTERDICSPNVKSAKNTDPKDRYQGGTAEWAFLERARAYDEKAALESASYGQFQVMGFNAVDIGYPTVQEFVRLMCTDVTAHLEALVRFLKATPVALKGMRNKNFQQVAEGYNGKGYATNGSHYDTKLQALEASVAGQYK